MTTQTVHADWVQGTEFLLRDRAGFPIVLNQPQGVNGADLLPLSLIGCAAWDVIAILRKQRQAVTSLRVSAEYTQDPEPPWRFRAIRLHYEVRGHGLGEPQVRRAIELSENRYCSIYATLRDAVALTTTVEILPAVPPAPG